MIEISIEKDSNVKKEKNWPGFATWATISTIVRCFAMVKGC